MQHRGAGARMPEGGPSSMHTASESTARKLKWLPREQWQRPYAEQQSNPDLSGSSPFTGMFSGFWPGPCLLPSIAGVIPAAEVAVPRAPSTSPLSREMAGHLALLDAPTLSPLASPASAGSDVSEASGEMRLPPEVANDLDASAQPHSSSRSRQARPPSTAGKHASSSMQGAGGPADEEGRPHGDQPKKRALEEGLAESEHKRQRREQDAVDRSHDRSPRRKARSESVHTDSKRDAVSWEQSKGRAPSIAVSRVGAAKHHSRESQRDARSRSHEALDRGEQWPFRRGRILSCGSSNEADMLRRLRFGSDHKADLEDLSPSTAVFLWNYEKQRLHGIFAGTSHLVKDTTIKDAAYLYEVRVKNYADYRSLPKEVAMRLVPKGGKTGRGQTLLRVDVDADHVDRLCTAFAADRSPS